MAGKYNNIMITFDERDKRHNATYAISNFTYVNFRNWALMRGTGKHLKEVAPTNSYANRIFLATGLRYNVAPNNNTRYFFVEGTTEFLYFYNFNGPHWDNGGNYLTATKARCKYLTENQASSFQPELGYSGHGKWMDPVNWGFPDYHAFADNYWSDGHVQHITFSIAVSDYPVTGISNKSSFLYTDLTDAVLTSPYISTILQNITKFRPYINDRSKLHDETFVILIATGQSYTNLPVPDVNSTTRSSAQSTYDRAKSFYDLVISMGTSFPQYSNIVSNYNSIKSAYDSIVARDARLTKKADKTELNTANTKARVEYTTPYTQGTEDYTSIKSTLTAFSKKLNS